MRLKNLKTRSNPSTPSRHEEQLMQTHPCMGASRSNFLTYKRLAEIFNRIRVHHVHSIPVPTSFLYFAHANRIIITGLALGLMRRIPTRARVGLTIEMVADAKTVIIDTARFVLDGVMQHQLEFFSSFCLGGKQVAFAELFLDFVEVHSTMLSFLSTTTGR